MRSPALARSTSTSAVTASRWRSEIVIRSFDASGGSGFGKTSGRHRIVPNRSSWRPWTAARRRNPVEWTRVTEVKDTVLELFGHPAVVAAVIATGSILAAYVLRWVFTHTVIAFTRKTNTDLDDQIVDALKRPVFLGVILIGLAVASAQLEIPDRGRFVLYGALKTLVILTTMTAAMKIIH